MKIQELRQLAKKKLVEKLAKTERELAVIRFHIKTGQLADVAQVKKVRRAVAQIKFLLHNEKN